MNIYHKLLAMLAGLNKHILNNLLSPHSTHTWYMGKNAKQNSLATTLSVEVSQTKRTAEMFNKIS